MEKFLICFFDSEHVEKKIPSVHNNCSVNEKMENCFFDTFLELLVWQLGEFPLEFNPEEAPSIFIYKVYFVRNFLFYSQQQV